MNNRTKPPLTTKSNIADFIRFFKKIPAKNWCVDVFRCQQPDGRQTFCARGHIMFGDKSIPNGWSVDEHLMTLAPNIALFNNGTMKPNGERACPFSVPKTVRSRGIKTRVLRYLKSLINKS